MPMRKLMAIVTLLCGAASTSQAQEAFCSGDGAQIAYADQGTTLLVKSGSKTERFSMFGSVGSGLNGTVFKDQRGKQSVLLYASIQMDSNPGHEDTRNVLIFRDRVFWPCKD